MGKLTLLAIVVGFWGAIILLILYPFVIKPLLKLYKAQIDAATDNLEQEKIRQMLEKQFHKNNDEENEQKNS